MGNHHHHTGTKNLQLAFFLNLFFTIFEIAGGLYINSMAILADALHDLGDSLSLGVSWYLQKKSGQAGDKKFSFGYQRFSLLGALINGFILIGGSVFILVQTIPRLMEPETPNVKGMIFFAIFGIVVNGFAALRLHKGKSLNEQMVSWHLLEDVLGWVAVLIASIVMLFTDFPVLDPILSILILLFVLFNVVKNLRNTLKIFLQGVPSEINLRKVEADILKLQKIASVHHAHVWSLEGEHNVMTIHVVIGEQVNTVAEVVSIKRKVKEILREVPIHHATIEVEFKSEDCYMDTDVEPGVSD